MSKVEVDEMYTNLKNGDFLIKEPLSVVPQYVFKNAC